MSQKPGTLYPTLPQTLILTSTKSFFSPSRTISYIESLLSPENGILPLRPDVLFGLIPDHLTIHACSEILSKHTSTSNSGVDLWPLYLGAQDCFWEPTYGAYTGFIVPTALKELGVTIVELGHAERRRFLGETDKIVAKKGSAVTSLGMVPLVCIGELERPNLESGPLSMAVGTAMRQLQPQITSLLDAVPSEAPVIFAYEPVWAIGAAEPASVQYVGPVVQAIRAQIQSTEIQKGRQPGITRVVYGGSAGPGLWSGRAKGGEGLAQYVDGMFLGRFAHEIKGVKDVVDEIVESLQTHQ
jgi:triosephosphate isomerase (TIM)